MEFKSLNNATRRSLVTSFCLVNPVGPDNSPQGFNIEKFSVPENRIMEVIEY